jgi:hypothetical protein
MCNTRAKIKIINIKKIFAVQKKKKCTKKKGIKTTVRDMLTVCWWGDTFPNRKK